MFSTIAATILAYSIMNFLYLFQADKRSVEETGSALPTSQYVYSLVNYVVRFLLLALQYWLWTFLGQGSTSFFTAFVTVFVNIVTAQAIETIIRLLFTKPIEDKKE